MNPPKSNCNIRCVGPYCINCVCNRLLKPNMDNLPCKYDNQAEPTSSTEEPAAPPNTPSDGTPEEAHEEPAPSSQSPVWNEWVVPDYPVRFQNLQPDPRPAPVPPRFFERELNSSVQQQSPKLAQLLQNPQSVAENIQTIERPLPLVTVRNEFVMPPNFDRWANQAYQMPPPPPPPPVAMGSSMGMPPLRALETRARIGRGYPMVAPIVENRRRVQMRGVGEGIVREREAAGRNYPNSGTRRRVRRFDSVDVKEEPQE